MMSAIRKSALLHCMITAMLLLGASCSSTRHVPEGRQMLDKVRIISTDTTKILKEDKMHSYLRSKPNTKIFWLAKFRLGLYNLSGKNSKNWWNRAMRNMGEPPALFDSTMMAVDAEQLKRAMVNVGFNRPQVEPIVSLSKNKKKASVTYKLKPGKLSKVRSVSYIFPDSKIEKIIKEDSANLYILKPGMPVSTSLLEEQRSHIALHLRQKGYYGMANESITFSADTTEGIRNVDLTMIIHPPRVKESPTDRERRHHQYRIRRVIFITDYKTDSGDNIVNYQAQDTVEYRGVTILYGKKQYLKPSILFDNCYLQPGNLYSLKDVTDTYNALGRLTILQFINIRFINAGFEGDEGQLDAYILLSPAKQRSLSAELEGTNSNLDLGVGGAVTYTNSNLAQGSQVLSVKVKTAYESLSGGFSDLIHNRLLETSGEATINFPQFLAPFLSNSFKKKMRASTEFNISGNYQERPEYTRIIFMSGYNYKWSDRKGMKRHLFTPLDINYVYLPESTNDFLDQIAPGNPLLRYSYEDHFIVRLGYRYNYTNKPLDRPWDKAGIENIHTAKFNAEIAGNALFAFNSIFNYRADHDQNPYRVFGIPYSQYARADGEYTYIRVLGSRSCLAMHVGGGIGIPYGNSTILPFEKRFFGGGANGVRGWQVRTLGPGTFPGDNKMLNFMNQCGDIRMISNIEYRIRWGMFEPAAFIDAGNIWTIKDYSNQPGGLFKFDTFYKQIAVAYGAGIRLNWDVAILRFDVGFKAHNPAQGAIKWPILHPKWGRDAAVHLAVSYPF